MKIKVISKGEEKEILNSLKKDYGISKLPYMLIKSGNEIRSWSGAMNKEDIKTISKELKIGSIGIPIGTKEKDGIKLNPDFPSIIKPIKKIIDLSDKQAEKYLKGENIKVNKDKGYYILRHKKDLIGCDKLSSKEINNTIPKRV